MRNSFPEESLRLKSPAQSGDLIGSQGTWTQLFDRAESDTIGLAQGAVDGTRFGHAKFSVIEDERRDVARMSVTVANEPAALGGLENGGFEDPKVLLGTAQGESGFDVDADTVVLLGHTK